MSDALYRALEDRHRGSRELIKSRLNCYLPFVEPLLGVDEELKALDLGCGRGEWLELTSRLGFDAAGVDLDQGMLDACQELGLKVEKAEALGFIAAMPDESQVIVSAFHVVEHITFEQLQRLVSEAFRVLKPGGLLIMETPNPENIVVATRNFYLDPTHQRPIPPGLLSFLPEYYGFSRTKVIRLQESPGLAQRVDLTLQDVLGGASPDYSVIAQKAAAENILSLLDVPFSLEYGLSLEYLTARYQDQMCARFQQAESKAQQAESKAQQAESKAQQAEAALQAIYQSRSWRITAPLRWLSGLLFRRGVTEAAPFAPTFQQTALRRVAVFMVNRGVSYAQKAPRFRRLVLRVLHLMPSFAHKLRHLHIKSKLAPYPQQGGWSGTPDSMPTDRAAPPIDKEAKRPPSLPVLDGINARQRTPLEAHFHAYLERE